jgi:progressive ankylosis protein
LSTDILALAKSDRICCCGSCRDDRLKFAKNQSSDPTSVSLGQLWREFIPLSLSDVTMACGDPLVTTTLAHLADPRTNLAGVGIAKALAIFFESPIIMLMHASNAVAAHPKSRQALWQFTLLAGGSLSLMLGLLASPLIFNLVGTQFLGIPVGLAATVQQVLVLMILWPFSIAWRRYFQGLLIHHGNSGAIANASIIRLIVTGLVLGIGVAINLSGAILAGSSLIIGVLVETWMITIIAYRCGATASPPTPEASTLPQTLGSIWRFYWPLGNTMLVTWGGRALLVGAISRAVDAPIALAAWPAASGLVLVIANSTRMLQQIIIKYQGRVADRVLLNFALSVGSGCSGLLLLISTTSVGEWVIQGFIGSDRDLINSIKPVVLICVGIPLLVAMQNATQGFLVGAGKTSGVNQATWIATLALLGIAWLSVQAGLSGAIAAAIATVVALLIEVSFLLWQRRS